MHTELGTERTIPVLSVMLLIKERALSLEGKEENSRKGEQGCHILSTLERDETSKHVTDHISQVMCLWRQIGERLKYTCDRKNQKLNSQAELTIIWLLNQRSFSSGTSHCPPQEAEPWAKKLVMTPVGDAGDPAEGGSERIGGNIQISIPLYASIQKHSGDDDLTKQISENNFYIFLPKFILFFWIPQVLSGIIIFQSNLDFVSKQLSSNTCSILSSSSVNENNEENIRTFAIDFL